MARANIDYKRGLFLIIIVVALIIMSGCSDRIRAWRQDRMPTATPTATFTPTPEPTPTLRPGETPNSRAQVTIPDGWAVLVDDVRGYSVAIPPRMREADLRSNDFDAVAGLAGQRETLENIQAFLESEEGKGIGVVALEFNVMGMMQGLIPPVLNVSVFPLDGANSDEEAVAFVESLLESFSQVASINIESIGPEAINSLPGLRAIALANTTKAGMKEDLSIEAVGIIANDQLYLLTMIARASERSTQEPIFNQIAGSLEPHDGE